MMAMMIELEQVVILVIPLMVRRLMILEATITLMTTIILLMVLVVLVGEILIAIAIAPSSNQSQSHPTSTKEKVIVFPIYTIIKNLIVRKLSIIGKTIFEMYGK